MRSYSHTEDHFTYISGSVYWTGAYVLSDLLLTEGAEAGGGHCCKRICCRSSVSNAVLFAARMYLCCGLSNRLCRHVQAHYVSRHCCAVTVLCCAMLRCAVPPLRCAAKGTSVRAEGAKVTRDDNWAADGLDLGKLPSQPRGNDYRSVKGEPATALGEITPL
jgi:hypothetical protein